MYFSFPAESEKESLLNAKTCQKNRKRAAEEIVFIFSDNDTILHNKTCSL